jgi:phosphoglycolate phosphatase
MPRFRIPHGVRAAIVDLDGTMVDTLGDFEVALGVMLSELSLPGVTRQFIEHTVGKGSDHLIRRTLEASGGDPAQFDLAYSIYQRHYLAINGEHSALYPGVVEGLEGFRAAGLKLACLTNKPGAFARPLLERKGLAGHFEAVFGGDAFERKKPDPLPLQRTCEALGCVPAQVLMVGDSANDAQAARAAGCPVVLVSYGYNHGQPVAEVDADGIVDRLDEIAAPG